MLGVAVEHRPERAGEVHRSALDPARARRGRGGGGGGGRGGGRERTLRWVRSR